MSSTSSPAPAGSALPSEFRDNGDSQGKAWQSSFAVIGDFGNVSKKENNLDVEKAPANYVGEAIRQMNPDFILALGDDNYVEGKREWKDFNVGKNYAPYIYPYSLMRANADNPDAVAISSSVYLSDQVTRKPWNRFFTAPGNHEVGMTGGKGLMEASGRRDWSHDAYYKAALEHSQQWGSVTPLAESYVKPGDILYYDYSYGTSWNPTTLFRAKEGAMDRSYYDYLLNPIDSQGNVLAGLANIYMVDRNNTAYREKNTAYATWKKNNPGASLDPQAAFMMNEAKKREQEVPWQIFASHYQTYSSSSEQEGMKLPFFANGIDLVMGSHVHNYERIRAADSAGAIGHYIVNGVGGYNTAYKAGIDFGAKELFPPIGSVSGYQAGSTGKWGFGWVDINMDELLYRQFVVDFTLVENPSLVGIQDAYWGSESIADVRISLVDTLRLRASSATDSHSGLNLDGLSLENKSALKKLDWSEVDWTDVDWNTSRSTQELDWGLVKYRQLDLNDYDAIDWGEIQLEELSSEDYKAIDWSHVDFAEIQVDPGYAGPNWKRIQWSEVDVSDYDSIDWSVVAWDTLDREDLDAIAWGYVDPVQLTNSSRDQLSGRGFHLGSNASDTFTGSRGGEVFAGYRGADLYRFDALSDSRAARRLRDVIVDFNGAEGDRIDLTGITSTLTERGSDDTWTFIGNDPFFASRQIRFNAGILQLSSDRDREPEFSLDLLNVGLGDFNSPYVIF